MTGAVVQSAAREPGRGLVVAAPLRLEARALRRGAPELRVLRTGAGPARARRAAARLRDDPCRVVAVAGLCGAVDDALAVGDVVVASGILGVSEALGPNRDLPGALAAAGFTVHVRPIASTDHLVRGAERERVLAAGAAAVDMESAWLHAGAAGRPFAVVRVVSDAPGREWARPAAALDLLRALQALRRLAPALAAWGADQAAL